MHSFWGNSDYTIDYTGRWYDENGDRICWNNTWHWPQYMI
jgi:hypothetical protein